MFQGTAHGTFAAYRASDGAPLWEQPAGTGIVAAPVTYELDGAQYVAVMAGWGGVFALAGGDAAAAAGVRRETNFGRLLVYRLGGTATLPVQQVKQAEIAALPAKFDKALVKRGSTTYARWCAGCHGVGAVSGGVLPDLRKSDPAIYDALDAIVLQGARSPIGMPRFDAFLNPDDVKAIRAYLLVRRGRSRDDRRSAMRNLSRPARDRPRADRLRRAAAARARRAIRSRSARPRAATWSDSSARTAATSGAGSRTRRRRPARCAGARRASPQPWQGTREALAFGARCPQYTSQLEATRELGTVLRQRGLPHAERVGAAAQPRRERLPVMFWIHGGGNVQGGSDFYDGAALAVQPARRGRHGELPARPARLAAPRGAARGRHLRGGVGQLRHARPDPRAALGARQHRRVRRQSRTA